MTTLKIMETVTKEDINRVQRKIVDDITEWNELSIYGRFKRWTGSTEAEYFNIYFMRGALIVALEEREIHLKENLTTFAITDVLLDLLSENKNNQINYVKSLSVYYDSASDLEVENLTLDEVFRVLDWKLKDGVKIKEGMTFNEYP